MLNFETDYQPFLSTKMTVTNQIYKKTVILVMNFLDG